MDEDAFVRAIRSNPADAAVRLFYADWLEERGDPRGEYLRLECELASLSDILSGARRQRLRKQLFKLRPKLDSDWLTHMGYRLRMLHGPGAGERMDELQRFLEFWYGPRKPDYGEPAERLQKVALPDPLARFYAFAGRWPCPEPATTDPDQFFYVGAGGHHLLPLDDLKALRGGRLYFFNEYQGDWQGLTLRKGKDPPVWIRGSWTDYMEEGRGTKQVSSSLSGFLVTHCLMASIYDYGNFRRDSWDEAMIRWFESEPQHAVRIWDARDCDCPMYDGVFYLFHDYILVHQGTRHNGYRFAANHAPGTRAMKQHLTKKPKQAKPS
jgi:uncharacterized protein (TIGR02996 family)